MSEATWLEAKPGLDWMERFYQYGNRLAHLYFLRKVNNVDARLVFLYFVGDEEMGGPYCRREWEAAIEVLHQALGVRNRLHPKVAKIFINVRDLSDNND